MPRGSDFFTASQSLDAQQVKSYLQSPDPFLQSVAIKHVIAQMTVGKDMSPHFSDVAQLVKSSNFEIKRLVYLYLMQNAKSQPDKTVLLAGTFVRDASHESPLIRGTAIRTMTAMQIPGMVSFSQSVVLKCLKDTDPYVRRNAAVGALKIHHVSPTIIHESGALHLLIELLSDPVASVVATAACVLAEITTKDKVETVDVALANMTETLLAALSECSEWSQVYLLRAISRSFKVLASMPGWNAQTRVGDCEVTAQRVMPFLQSNNSSVVFSAVRVVLSFLTVFCSVGGGGGGAAVAGVSLTPIQQADLERRYVAKVAQPLVSMLSGVRPEMRYVALRNLRVIAQRHKDPFVQFASSFYLKFDDAIYVKLEKLDLLLSVATKNNAEAILAEFAEYTKEIDVELVRKAVRCVGVLAVKQPSAAPQCVERLVQLIESKVPYIVQEAAVVVQNVLRQYPTQYEGIIVTLCKAIAVLDEAESKAAVIWVVGEYADRIANAVEIVNQYFESFQDESLQVQLATLTATVKVYLTQRGSERDPAKQAALERVLALATSSPIPDLRDRAHLYWRLILKSAAAAAMVVRAEKDRIVDVGAFDRLVLNELLQDVGSLSCVIHRPAAALLAGDDRKLVVSYDDADEYIDEQARARAVAALESGGAGPVPQRPIELAGGPADDASQQMDFSQMPTAQARHRTQLTTVLDATTHGKGLEVSMAWLPGAPLPSLRAQFTLKSPSITVLKISVMQLNANRYGIGLGQEFPIVELKNSSAAGGGEAVIVQLALNCSNAKRETSEIQVALRTDELGVLFFVAPPIDPTLIFGPAPPAMDPAAYAHDFGTLPIAWVLPTPATPERAPRVLHPENLTKSALKNRGLLLVHSKTIETLVGLHVYTVSVSGGRLFAEVTIEGGKIVLLNVKTSDPLLADVFGDYVLTSLISLGGSS